MPIEYDHELLRQRRELVEPVLTAYAIRVGLPKAAVSRIETGVAVRRVTLEKYLSGLELKVSDIAMQWRFEQLSPPNIQIPRSINFRPIYWPNAHSDRWRTHPFGIVPIGMVIVGGATSSRLQSLKITIHPVPELKIKQMDFRWLYWVRLDNAPREEHPDPNTQWRGEYDAFGDGSTVSARSLRAGEQLTNEIFFASENCGSWRDFSATMTVHDVEKYELLSLRMDLHVEWFERRGTRVLTETFSVPAKCLYTGFTATSRNDLKLAKFLQLRTLEGGKNACGFNCC